MAVLARALVVMAPYVISGAFSRRLISAGLVHAALFAAVLALCTVVQAIVIIYAQAEDRFLLALIVSLAETFLLMLAARILFGGYSPWGSNNRWRGP